MLNNKNSKIFRLLVFSFLGVGIFITSRLLFIALIQFLDLCNTPINERMAADFFYFLGFAEVAFKSSQPYIDSNSVIGSYLCVDHLPFAFSYPPNVLTLIAPLKAIKSFFGQSAVITAIPLINLSFCALIAYICNRISGFGFLLSLGIVLTTNYSLVALVSGQLSISFALILTLFFSALIKEKNFIAGFLLSLLFIKPQIAILLGLYALTRPKLIPGIISGSVFSSLVALVIGGTAIFRDYFNSFFLGQSKSAYLFADRAVTLPSLLMQNYDLSEQSALLIYIAIAALIVFALVHTFRHDVELKDESKLALLGIANLLICPYALVYDFILALPAFFLLAKQFKKDSTFLTLSFIFFYASSTAIRILGQASDAWLFLLFLFVYIIVFKTRFNK